ncbi:MAG: hypothetical protein DRO18_02770 [Thermoprotei archaeon]|nr:MAG: hypothetical protein DRO18_02770 [Thermoprotei archaeon]
MEKVIIALWATVAYMAFVLAIGFWASRRVKDLVDYIVAGRRLGFWLTFGTILATWFGTGVAVGGASMAYSFGLRGIIMDPIGAGLCILLFGLFFAHILRKLRYVTISDFFRVKYGKAMEVLSMIIQVIAYMGWTASLLVTFGDIFEVYTGIPWEQGLLIGTLVTIVYTMLGGMWAVTLTDFAQMVIFLTGVVLAVPFVINVAGGWGVIASKIPPDMYSILPGPKFEYLGYVGLFGMMYYISSWLVQGLGSLSCQDLVQRALSAKDAKTSRYASIASAVGYWTIGLIPALIGIWATIILPDLENPDYVLPMIALKYLPLPIFTIFTVGLLAALMSSADSSMLIPSSMVAWNLLPMVKPNLSERTKLLISRILVPVFAFASLAIALWAKTIYFLMNLSWELILMVQGIPFILGIYWKKANRSAAIASVIVNFAVWIPLIFFVLPHCLVVEEGVLDWAVWDAIYIAALPALVCGTIAFIVTALLTQKRDPPRPLLDIEGKPVE